MIDWKQTEKENKKTKTEFLVCPSNKKVYAICDECGKGRWIQYVSYRALCGSCVTIKSHTPPKPKFIPIEKDRFLNNTQVDRILTIEKFGYDPVDLSYGSSRKVIRICKNCHKIDEVVFQYSGDLCQSCSSLPITPKFIKEEDRFIPETGIDRIETIKQFGYDPFGLSKESGRKIIAICINCGKIRKIQKSHYHDLCKSCAFSKPKIILNCLQCGEILKLHQSQIRDHNFCTHECYSEWMSENLIGENSPSWNPNITDEERKIKRQYPEYIQWRKDVYERDNYTCQKCNIRGNRLNAHHIESYANNKELRTNLENGITLCKDCHKDFHCIYGHNNNKEQFIKFMGDK